MPIKCLTCATTAAIIRTIENRLRASRLCQRRLRCIAHEGTPAGTSMKSVVRLRNTLPQLGAIACVLLLHSSATSAGALTQGGEYELLPAVVGAGGTTMHGNTWTLDGTVAQPTAISQDGAAGIHLKGGFWHATQVVPANDRIFANGFDP